MIKRITFLLLPFLLTLCSLYGNNIVDSICHELESIKDEDYKLKRYFYYVSELQLHNPNVAYEKAEDYLALAKKLDNKFHTGVAHYRLGSILHLQTKFAASTKQLQTALIIFEEIQNQEYIAETNVALSSLYMTTGNFKESELRLKKGIAFIRTKNDNNRLADLYFNLGNLVSFTKEYDSALYYIELSENYFRQASDSLGISRSTLSKGAILHLNGDFKNALKFAKQGLHSSERLEDIIGIQASLTSIGSILKDLEQYDSAEVYLHKAYQMDSLVQNPDMTADICKELSELYDLTGDHEQSNEYLKQYLELNNLLFSPENLSKLTDLISQFELQKKETELLEKKSEAARKRLWLIVSAAFLTICLLVISYLIIRSKKTKKEQLKKIELYESEQQILNEILERRNRELVANSLNLTKKDQILKSVSRELTTIKRELAEKGIGDAKLRRVMREIRPEIARKSQNLFEKQFIDTHPKFYERIMERSETLTPNERKLCAFLRLNMTTKEIAELTEQSPRAVEVARHRLRKKLKLKRSENLTSYLANLSTE